jgi:uncharacterized phosphosugar-binding protein
VPGDAAVKIAGLPSPGGPTLSLTDLLVLNLLVVAAIVKAVAQGLQSGVFINNSAGGGDSNQP